MKMNKAQEDIDIDAIHYLAKDTDTSIYIFNFKNNGFVIIPSDDHSFPVLAYSMNNSINLNNINTQLKDWLMYYSYMVEFNKKERQKQQIKNEWVLVDNGVMTKSIQTTVPSLFETNNSSRWAGWRPYYNQAPQAQPSYYEGTNGCVPGAISQVMKYFEYPIIGTGIGSGYNNGAYFTQKINCYFDYRQMPFRLTYCAGGTNNCNDSSFDIIPGITQAQIDEVGKIQYTTGLAVGMRWIGMGDSTTYTGTTGDTEDWVTEMANHFYYSSPTASDFWSQSEISANTSAFKTGLRTSLDNGHPILFRYNTRSTGEGHVIVIDGYEDDDFFHFSMGWGGDGDAYYYLFSSDDDGIHLPRPHISLSGLNACLNIRPNCPPFQDQTVSNIIISNSDSQLIQSGKNLTINNFTIQSGGRAVLRADQEILISSNFEVALGGEIWIVSQPCSN
jgi:hypothetical protein